MNVKHAAGLPARGSRRRVPWDWTDILLFLTTAFVVAPIGALLLRGLAHVGDAAVSGEARTAVQAFAGATGVYLSWVAVVLGLVVIRRHASVRDLGWRRVRRRWLAIALPVSGATLIAAVWLAELSARLLPGAGSGQCTAVRHEFGHALGIAIVLVSIIDPAAEETIFRGFVYGWLRNRLPVAAAVAVSAAIFGAAHADLLLFLPLFGVGVVLAIVYELSGSLLISAVVHSLFNAYNVVAILNAPSC
ncbi:MAG: lysostaphin resistance A-like protein [Candidatus Dormibacteria bacterium]